ncbi:S9 family peptidase [Nocardioides sp. Iso805N]|uniref:S9 family peptidase n=1 Tax=Nocardioides sp. Iso805N TaxID=1283287 RepID=UPI0003801C60|nr:S9 family peptidase [Nocardioides sp. Iso805N]
MRTAIDHDDLMLFSELGDVRLSPDGKQVAATQVRMDPVSNTYRSEVVLGPIDGPLTAIDAGAPGATSSPVWVGTDGRLAVVVRQPGGWAIKVGSGSGEWATVAEGIPDAVQELAIAPDASRLLFVVREPVDREWFETPEDRRPPLRLTSLRYREDGIGWTVNTRRQAYLVPLAGGPVVRLTDGAHDDSQFSWEPTGSSVFFVSQRHPEWERSPINDVFRMTVDADGVAGDPERLTATDGEFASPRCSPDGRLLSYGRVDVIRYPQALQLAVLDLSTGKSRLVTESIDRDTHADAVVWTGPETLVTLVDRSGRIELVEFDASTGDASSRLGGDYRVTAFDVRDEAIAFVRSATVEPPCLLAGAPEPVVIHAPNEDLAAARILADAEHRPVEVEPGVTVDSWLVRPTAASESWPLIVWLQGGGSQFGYQWSHEVQLLAAQGFAVLYLNARGSAGYGTAWMRAVNGARAEIPGQGWGAIDIADVSAVVEHTLAAVPELDAERVGVMGGSYGGLVTTHLLGQTELFRAGWAERGPYNLLSDAGTKDEAPWFFEAYLGSDHLQDPESYWQASPLRVAAGITAPLAIVHSENDFRCTIGQAEELFMALKLLGREVEFVRFPGEGHSLTRNGTPVHRLQRSQILTEWFGKHLTPSR